MINLKDVADAASEAHEADIFAYSGPIDDEGFAQLAAAVTVCAENDRRRAILILVTNGGQANAGYKIARTMQKMYDEFWLYCPRFCKSAGTLVAIGAHRLIMDSFSELGPLDVQLLKEDELGARKSGLLAKSTFDALGQEAFNLYERLMLSIKFKSHSMISFKLASQLSADMASNLLSQVYSQISPDIVGNEQRDLEIALQYGHRLDAVSDNAMDGHTVQHLVQCYPSHDFIIDDDEARSLFNNVDVPSEELYRVVAELGPLAFNEAENPIVLALSAPSAFEEEEDEDEDALQDLADDAGAVEVDDSGQGDQQGNPAPAPTPIRGQPATGDAEVVQDNDGEVQSGTG